MWFAPSWKSSALKQRQLPPLCTSLARVSVARGPAAAAAPQTLRQNAAGHCPEMLTLPAESSASLLTVRNVSPKCENIYAVRFPIISSLSIPLICMGYS